MTTDDTTPVYTVLLEIRGDIGDMKGNLGLLTGQMDTLKSSVEKIDVRLQSVEKRTWWHSSIVSLTAPLAKETDRGTRTT